jgi:hypothetical protein
MKTETIVEFVDSRGVALKTDREAGIIRGVKLLGLTSRNGRTYLKETIARAANLYEGAKVNVNHPVGQSAQPRDYRDRMGSMRSVRVGHAQDGLFADFHFNPKHALAEQLIWDAENAPENVGFSHNVDAKVSRARDGKVIVEEISRVQSVDLVADPATTRGLFEHNLDSEQEGEDMPATLESLQAEQPDLLKSIRETAVTEHVNSEAVKTAAAEKDAKIKEQADQIKALTEQTDAFTAKEKAAAHKATVDKELAEAKLPKTVLTDVFTAQLYGTEEAKDRKALLEDRQAIAKQMGSGKPQSKEQNLSEGNPDGHPDFAEVKDGESFAKRVKGR